jgi:hypothetical protein
VLIRHDRFRDRMSEFGQPSQFKFSDSHEIRSESIIGGNFV